MWVTIQTTNIHPLLGSIYTTTHADLFQGIGLCHSGSLLSSLCEATTVFASESEP